MSKDEMSEVKTSNDETSKGRNRQRDKTTKSAFVTEFVSTFCYCFSLDFAFYTSYDFNVCTFKHIGTRRFGIRCFVNPMI